MSTYSSFWLSRPTGVFKKSSRQVTRIRIVPCGWDSAAYFTREEAPIKAKKYQIVEESRIDARDDDIGAASEVIQKFLHARASLSQTHTEVVLQDSLCLYPADAEAHREKLPHELALDAAMLAVEMDDFNRADELLDSLGAQYKTHIFAHTVRRRLEANRAAALNTTENSLRAAHMARAHDAADAVICRGNQGCANQADFYGFGDDYRRVESQLAAAHGTNAEYWLNCANAARALESCLLADDTCHATTDNWALKARALFSLERKDEAYALVQRYRFDWLTEISESADYKKYIERSATEADEAEAKRIAKIKILPAKTNLRDAAEIAAWQEHAARRHATLPATFESWLCEQNVRNVTVTQPGNEDDISAEYTSEYPFISPEQSGEYSEALVDWIHLHDKGAPELAAEIRQCIAESGINADKMLPVVAVSYSPDCFLLRLDGDDKTERGAIYFWSHDQLGTFERIADDMPALYAWLETSAREGNVFSL